MHVCSKVALFYIKADQTMTVSSNFSLISSLEMKISIFVFSWKPTFSVQHAGSICEK